MRKIAVLFITVSFMLFHYMVHRRDDDCSFTPFLSLLSVNFENFDNVSGTESGVYIIPNIVHLIRFGKKPLTFIEAVCMLSILKNQKPDKLVIHTNEYDENRYDRYLEIVKRHSSAQGKIEIRVFRQPESIFGQQLSSKWRAHHAADIAKLEVLMAEGGIFLDNDCYVARNLNEFRAYEMAIGWREGERLSKHAIVAHRDARFLAEWYNSYKDYRKDSWDYNAVEKPEQIITEKPYLVHRVPFLFAERHNTIQIVYLRRSTDWYMHYVIHLLINNQKNEIKRNLSPTAKYPVEFNETNILKYNANIRDMVKDVYDFASQPARSSVRPEPVGSGK